VQRQIRDGGALYGTVMSQKEIEYC